ncbi:MAG: adenine phosphoribosyltransferase [Myxococcales bacterium]|nr:adenine phosphoribosyltransferase [Myxococcales bacterium]
MTKTYDITVGEVSRKLPIRAVSDKISVALFDMLGDWELTEAAGKALSKLIPEEVEVLVMPDGKATSLLHVVGRETGLPTIVARKAKKPYMQEPVLEVSVKSITTDRVQTLFLGADQVEAIKGKRVATLDDVVSTGGTLKSMHALYEQAGAQSVATIAIFTEGGERDDVISLGNLPLF